MILLMPILSGKKKDRVKYGLDYFLDNFIGRGGGGDTPLVLREGCDAVYRVSPYTSFGLPPLLNCFTIEQSTVKTYLYVN